ncbi:hypothetical protein J3Q64DRAFT_1831612 [Phycomyces blakesleeanus]|uniref:Uncharacterized protein n=1 Tax=Phycomyces blakesleeanus TaxID=4837 RepID=A0ABR3B8T1_PHYBL
MVGALENTPTNRVYQLGQHIFIAWALQHNVSITKFSVHDLINFLVYDHSLGYSLGTIKNHCTAALKLHRDPTSFYTHKDIHSLFARLATMAPPTRHHKTHVDLTPTLSFLASIPSLASSSLAALSQKTAFLLAMAAFLRPSDLHCLQLTSAYLWTNMGALVFDVHAPKECRRGQQIVKTIMIQPHTTKSLCLIQAFLALRDHPQAATQPPTALFVKSHSPSISVKVTTISTWLRDLVHLSTDQSVSVWSLASSLAMDRGMPVKEIVTLVLQLPMTAPSATIEME